MTDVTVTEIDGALLGGGLGVAQPYWYFACCSSPPLRGWCRQAGPPPPATHR